MKVTQLSLLGTSLIALSVGIALPGFAQTQLLSQLQGHDTYKGEAQIAASSYQIGKIVGQAGDILSVRLEDGTVFNGAIPNPSRYHRINQAGSNVLVTQEDGDYEIVDFAHPMWIEEVQ